MPQSAKAAAANTEASSEGVQARCDAWWQRMLESRDPDGPVHPTLPPDVAPVQTRLVRAVGRGTLADGRSVYLKAMDFPRWKDRLRYLFRALPAAHEAALLREVAATGLNCPVVVYAATARRWAMPWRSLLITEALPVAAQSAQKHGPVTWSEASAVAARLAEAGVFHPDLHRLNLERLDDGGVAVLDLQSARARGVSLKAAERLHMAAKLLAEPAERGLLDQLRAGCDKAGLLASPSAALGSGREISGSDASDAVAPNSKLATEAAGLPGDGGHGDSGAVAGGPEISSAAVTAVVASGLLPEVSAGALAASAAGTALEGFRRLISRCLRTSTQTVVRRRPWATTWLRRGLDAERATAIAVAVPRGQARKLWIGQRGLMLAGGPIARLLAARRASLWLPGRDAVYIPAGQESLFREKWVPELLAGFVVVDELCRRASSVSPDQTAGFRTTATERLRSGGDPTGRG